EKQEQKIAGGGHGRRGPAAFSGYPPAAPGEKVVFSSRGRHTRWPRDWSSDVCSSDLRPATARSKVDLPQPDGPTTTQKTPSSTRSEERRVGKECRSRWWPSTLKKETRNQTSQRSWSVILAMSCGSSSNFTLWSKSGRC